MFKSSCYFSYVWVKVVKKVRHTSSSTLNHFAGCTQGLCLIDCFSEFLCLFRVGFFYSIYLTHLVRSGVVMLVIEYIWYVNTCVECYFIYCGFFYLLLLLLHLFKIARSILNKSWWQHPTRHQLYGHLPPITKTIQVRRTRHAEHCWRSRDELISDVLLWTPTHGRAKAGRPARTYIQQLCEDTGCSPEDLPETMNDRRKWRERVRDIRTTSTTWWWWCYCFKDL